MSSGDGSKAPSSQVPLYLWGGSIVHPDARIITFRPFYFSLGFKFPLSKLFKEVFYAMGCAPSQAESFLHAQVRVYKAKLFNSLSQGDHAWHDDVLEVSGRWEAKLFNSLSPNPITYCDVSDINKQLELGPDMAKVRRALNIPLRFREWRWLLSEYREEDGGLPPTEDVERWKKNGPDLDDLLGG
ncbi:hypothetical protein L3X38_042789 [Prunus dulcis]|uniref:Uncharacterized protein n=1 Tax=Prunus dulcis TaxID=3755 RepID=A0AAD4YMA7_PRUDU|nr:hypothetical protein L3X38_042789 [Prunus dulcis]